MCIRKLTSLTVYIILDLYHQDLSANAIVAERSMTHVSTDKMMHLKMATKKKKTKRKKPKLRLILVFDICGATLAYILI